METAQSAVGRKFTTGGKSSTAPTPHVTSHIGEVDSVVIEDAIMIVDAGATSTHVSKKWFEEHCDWLRSIKIEIPRVAPRDMVFRFGNGNALPATGQPLVPICPLGAWINLDAHLLDATRPALLSVNSRWDMDAVVRLKFLRLVFRKGKTSVHSFRSTSGHPLLPMAHPSSRLHCA